MFVLVNINLIAIVSFILITVIHTQSSSLISNVSSLTLETTPSLVNILQNTTSTVQINVAPTQSNVPVSTSFVSNNGNASFISPTTSGVVMPSSLLFTGPPTTTFDPRCLGKEDWDNSVYDLAVQTECEKIESCTNSFLTTMNLFLQCNSHTKAEEGQFIAGTVNVFLLSRAEYIYELHKAKKDAVVDEINQEHKHFSSQYGFIQRDYLSISEPIIFKFDDDNFLSFPDTGFEQEITLFVFSVFKNVYKPENEVKMDASISPLLEALGTLDESILPENQDIDYKMNSDIISLVFDKSLETQRDYVQLTLKLTDRFNTKNHRCIVLPGRLGTGNWRSDLCHIYQDNKRSIVCRCKQMIGHYAIISEIDIAPPPDFVLVRDMITTVFMIICCIVFLICLISFALPFMVGCSHLKGMLRVYRYADLTFFIHYAVFLYGVYHSDDVDKAKLVAPVLHFLHHAIMMWFMAEGIHIYHGMNPLYSDTTGMIFFYSTIVFGTAAALAGSGAGYDFEFTGRAQYVWATGKGGNMIYFIIPTLVIVVFTVLFDALLVYELMSWIGSKTDYLYARAGKFLTRSIGYTLVLVCTNMFGIISMQNDGSGAMSYFFMGFMGIQAICVFYFHVISNYEVWTWKEEQENKFTNLEEEESVMESDEEKEESEIAKGNETARSNVSKKEDPEPTTSRIQLTRKDSKKAKESLSRSALRNSTKSLKKNPEERVEIPEESSRGISPSYENNNNSQTELMRSNSDLSRKADSPTNNTQDEFSPTGSQVQLMK